LSKSKPDPIQPTVPEASLWRTPITWTGENARPSDISHCIPGNAVFTRARIQEYNTGKMHPALLYLHKGKVFEVHFNGLDSRPWTYRRVQRGRKTFYDLFVGNTFPAAIDPIPVELRNRYANELEYVIVQSVLPLESTDTHILFMIRDDGELDELLKAAEKDDEEND